MFLLLGPPHLEKGRFQLEGEMKKGDKGVRKGTIGEYGVDGDDLVLLTLQMWGEEWDESKGEHVKHGEKTWYKDVGTILEGGSSVRIEKGSDVFVLEKVKK
jgi:hypothetical protein